MANIVTLIPVPCFQPIPVFPPAHFHFKIPHLISARVPRLPQSAGVPRLPEGVLFKMRTLPVCTSSIPDGDGINVYVNILDLVESSMVPEDVILTAVEISKARARRNFGKANELHQKLSEVGYQLINHENKKVLARKFRLRLRGIDAPENDMPYGKEAKEELIKLVCGKQLTVLVYDMDRYGRYVADVYCHDTFVQEVLLKKGLAWHYAAYDHRPEFAIWENEARAKGIGLWASPNPEKPWDWRKDRREGR